MLAKAAWQATQLDWVYIHCCGNGYLGFRPDGGSLLNSAKVSKTLLPHHSAPRLGSVCPNTGLNSWAAATRHPWRGAANPASCRVTHEFKPAFGQRGLTGRLRSRSRADQERLASHRGYRQIKSCSLRIVVRLGWGWGAFAFLGDTVQQQRLEHSLHAWFVAVCHVEAH